MPGCPICDRPLETVRQREGLYYSCANCDGRAMTIAHVRHVLGDAVATKLLRLFKLSRGTSEHACPFCHTFMLQVQVLEPPLELEACRSCNVVWFDLPTYESLPQITDETLNSRAMQSNEIIGLMRLKELKEREDAAREEEKQKKKRRRLMGPREEDDNLRS